MNNNVFPNLSLKEWIEKFNTLEKPPKISTIKTYFQKYKNNQLELYSLFNKKQSNQIIDKFDHYSYIEKYYEEKEKWEKGGLLSYKSKALIEIFSWERDISNNLYLKIADRQEAVEKFILGDNSTNDNGRFIYIKYATNESFFEFIQYINKFVEEYMKILDLKENQIFRNIKGRTYQEKENNLNLTIDLINELLYLQDKNREMIKHINLQDFRDLRKELLKNIDKIDIEFSDFPNNLASLINEIESKIKQESKFINEQIKLENELKTKRTFK
ncbi:hypothetical protein [Arcobacter sp.]|uniref:hypothetical protein n=1 Tax=Arcobacter sp. TaxID=1872629 RepID=UPI003D10FA34